LDLINLEIAVTAFFSTSSKPWNELPLQARPDVFPAKLLF
jgi:hypothetical protein